MNMKFNFKMNTIVRHYKGQCYRILHIGDHTETREKLVVYEQLYENEYPYGYVWCRPYEMFHEKIIYNNNYVNRFERVVEQQVTMNE